MNDKDYLFSVNLGHYDSFSEYNGINARKRLTGDLYEEEGNQWQWNSTQNRIKYDRMRIKSVTYKKYSQFAIGGLVLHRLISLIDVIYLERQHPNVSLLPNLSTNSVSLLTVVISSTGPHWNAPAIAPIVDDVDGTTLVKSISFTCTPGETRLAIYLPLVMLL